MKQRQRVVKPASCETRVTCRQQGVVWYQHCKAQVWPRALVARSSAEGKWFFVVQQAETGVDQEVASLLYRYGAGPVVASRKEAAFK